MAISMRVIGWMTKHMERGGISMLMVVPMKENGKMISRMVKVIVCRIMCAYRCVCVWVHVFWGYYIFEDFFDTAIEWNDSSRFMNEYTLKV